MHNEYDGKNLEDILNPPKNDSEPNADDKLVEDIQKLVDNQSKTDPNSYQDMDYLTFLEEEKVKMKHKMNMFYGGWALYAFGGDILNKAKEWWKK